jgi:hypothetical protein
MPDTTDSVPPGSSAKQIGFEQHSQKSIIDRVEQSKSLPAIHMLPHLARAGTAPVGGTRNSETRPTTLSTIGFDSKQSSMQDSPFLESFSSIARDKFKGTTSNCSVHEQPPFSFIHSQKVPVRDTLSVVNGLPDLAEGEGFTSGSPYRFAPLTAQQKRALHRQTTSLGTKTLNKKKKKSRKTPGLLPDSDVPPWMDSAIAAKLGDSYFDDDETLLQQKMIR